MRREEACCCSNRGGQLEAFRALTRVVMLLLVGAGVAMVELKDLRGVIGVAINYICGKGGLLRQGKEEEC